MMGRLQGIWSYRARLWQLLQAANDSFWLRPAAIVLAGLVLAEVLTGIERADLLPQGLIANWLYSGGETGARTLLGAVAGSTIGVAGTLFSITIATLTLASSQMGPRLLRNFTRDRANQAVLGIYLGTFVYSLMVLRTVRGGDELLFVPHLAITGALVLALLCVAMLIFFVHHIATRINSETVIGLVWEELQSTLTKLTTLEPQRDPPPAEFWMSAQVVHDERSGFIQQLDVESLADWAHENDAALRLDARPGDFVFPGAPIAVVVPATVDPTDILQSAIALGASPTASMDIEFTVNQLVDIAVRALSPGINDPNTAIRVIDYLGAALCSLVARRMLTGVAVRDDRIVLVRDVTTYDGMTDAMFNVIRQSAAGSPTVFIHLLDVLTKVASCERAADRLATLRRHADLIRYDAERSIRNPEDLRALIGRADRLGSVLLSRQEPYAVPAPRPG